MAYNSKGLYVIANTGRTSVWVLETVDTVANADAAGYISDAGTANSGKGAPGKGLKPGDIVFVKVVNDIAIPPDRQTVTDVAWAYVSAVNSTTGAGTITVIDGTP